MKDAKEGFRNFTMVVDRPEFVLAKINAANLSDVCIKKKAKYLICVLIAD